MDKNISIGEKILALRKAKRVTQSDLGIHLNISYQAVSKWERGESVPDFDTLSRIAQFFNVPISYFEKGGENKTVVEKEEEEENTSERGEMLGVCKDCGLVVYKGEEFSIRPELICNDCQQKRKRIAYQKSLQEKREREKKIAEEKAQRLARENQIKRSIKWSYVWAALATIVVLVCLFIFGAKHLGVWGTIGVSVAVLVFMFTFVTQLFWDGVVADIFFFSGKVIGTPGIIFTFDWDGFAFLIGMKILFAVLRLLVFIFTWLCGCAVAIAISPFTFFFALARVKSGDLLE